METDIETALRRVAEIAESAEHETPASRAIKIGIRDLCNANQPVHADMMHVLWWFVSNMSDKEGIPMWAQFAVISKLEGSPAALMEVDPKTGVARGVARGGY
jgi:hypothetical protein